MDEIAVTFTLDELQAIHAALLDKINNLNGLHPFVKQYRHTLECADVKIKLAANAVFGVSCVSGESSEHTERKDEVEYMRNLLSAANAMKKNQHLHTPVVAKIVTAIDVAYRTTIDLARETNSPIEFVCGTFNCGDCEECKTCETVRPASEWEQRYNAWKESVHGTDKNK